MSNDSLMFEDDDDFDFALPEIDEDILPSGRGKQQDLRDLSPQTRESNESLRDVTLDEASVKYDNHPSTGSNKTWSPRKSVVRPRRLTPKRKPQPRRPQANAAKASLPETEVLSDNTGDSDSMLASVNDEERQEFETVYDDGYPDLDDSLEQMFDEISDRSDSINDDWSSLQDSNYTEAEVERMSLARHEDDDVIEAWEDSAFEPMNNDDSMESVLANIHSGASAHDDFEDHEDDDFENFRVTKDDLELLKGFSIDEVLSTAIEMNASDVHITPDQFVNFSIRGDIVRMAHWDKPTPDVTIILGQSIISNIAETQFANEWESNTSYIIKSGVYHGRRMRLNMKRGHDGVLMTFRVISDEIPLVKDLGIEQEIIDWASLPNGLIMVNGPTGTGKSTTIASVIQNIQLTRPVNIMTVEKPIEYIYGEKGRALITQREVGKDTLTFMAALESMMRSAPDVIVVGEVRNKIEIDALLTAADTGHLAISTMHTNSAPETINRIKGIYNGDEQTRILGTLSSIARGFANQVLVKTPDGKGRFAVREILTVDEEIANLIEIGDDRAIRKLQEARGITLEHNLVKAIAAGKCTIEDAKMKTAHPILFNKLLDDLYE